MGGARGQKSVYVSVHTAQGTILKDDGIAPPRRARKRRRQLGRLWIALLISCHFSFPIPIITHLETHRVTAICESKITLCAVVR